MIEFRGIKYKFLVHIFLEFNISKSNYSYYKRKGMSEIDSIEDAINYKESPQNAGGLNTSKKITVFGVEYDSVSKAIEALDLDHAHVYAIKSKFKINDIVKAIEKVFNDKSKPERKNKAFGKEFEYKGVKYYSIREFCKMNSFAVGTFHFFKKRHPNKSLERIADMTSLSLNKPPKVMELAKPTILSKAWI